MSVVDTIFKYVTDTKKRLSSRATIVILALVLVLIADNIIGFSKHYNTSRELERLESISKLLKEDNLSEATKTKLIELERETLDRKNIIDHSVEFLSNISWNNKTEENILDNELAGRSNFWFLISASGIYLLAMAFIVPVLLFLDWETPIFTRIATSLMYAVLMIFTSWFNYWLFDKITPNKLFGSWTWNYIANGLMQIGLIFAYLGSEKYFKNKT